MEDHEREHITRNLPRLILITEVNDGLLAIMQGQRILSTIDCQALQARRAHHGAISQAVHFYEMMQNREGAYNSLIEALESPSMNQNAAANILKQLREEAQNPQPALAVTTTSHSISQEENNGMLRGNNASTSPIPSSHTPSSLPSSVGTSAAIQTFAEIEREYMNYVMRNAILSVAVERPTIHMHLINENRDYYKLPYTDKGIACILNIHTFDRLPDNQDYSRDGSKNDVIYLKALLRGLGFQIFVNDRIDENKDRWTKDELLRLVQDFKTVCRERKPNSIIFFVGSHGKHNLIYTSDHNGYMYNTVQLYEDIVSQFYHKTCPELEGKPKIFFVSACQHFRETPEVPIDASPLCLDLGVSDLIVCAAQAPGFASYRNPNYGTWFIHCLTFVMMKYACEKSLREMLTMVSLLLERTKKEDFPTLVHGQIPEVRTVGMKELFFNLPYYH